jgi:serine/threonine protein kinase
MHVGQQVGPYTIVERIGRGGMASVYRAYEAALDRHVALKILPHELLERSGFSERFSREARLIARLEHPNIVPLYAFGIDAEVPWMALRLVTGGHLGERLEASPLPIDPGLRMFRMIASALDHAHAHAVIHRDLKPQNVLLGERGELYLADFGVARLLEAGTALTQTGAAIGTPQYMAPEQAKGEDVGPAADIYALGVMAYRWLGGALPFDADTPYAVMYKHVASPLPLEPLAGLHPLARAAIEKALAKSPGDRWTTATQFIDALAHALLSIATASPEPMPPIQRAPAPEAAPVPQPAVAPSASDQKARPRLAVAIAATFAVLAVGALAFGWLWTRPSEREATRSSTSPIVATPSASDPAAPSAPPSATSTKDARTGNQPELVLGDTLPGLAPAPSTPASQACAAEFFGYRNARMQGSSAGKPVTMEWQWTGEGMGLITLTVQGVATRVPYACKGGMVVADNRIDAANTLQSLDVGAQSRDGSLRVVAREPWTIGTTTVDSAVVQRKDSTGASRLRMLVGAPILLEDSSSAWKAEQLKIEER